MYAQEVEIKGGERYQRMNATLPEAPVPVLNQCSHVIRSVGGLHRREADSLPPVRVLHDDVAVAILILPRIAESGPAKAAVQFSD